MPGKRRGPPVGQAWVELRAVDPAAQTAFQAMRAHLKPGHGLRGVRRARMLELCGKLPPRSRLEELLHRSIQFYNPHKETCVVRRALRDRLPVEPEDTTVVVWDREGSRSGAAERWLLHETGRAVEVWETTVWVLAWEPSILARDRLAGTKELAVLRDRRHGLLANPHAEEARIFAGPPVLPALPHSSHERSRP